MSMKLLAMFFVIAGVMGLTTGMGDPPNCPANGGTPCCCQGAVIIPGPPSTACVFGDCKVWPGGLTCNESGHSDVAAGGCAPGTEAQTCGKTTEKKYPDAYFCTDMPCSPPQGGAKCVWLALPHVTTEVTVASCSGSGC